MKTPLEQREAGRKADDVLARKQVEALVEQLREEGRQVAADLVDDLIMNLDSARGRIAALTAKPKRQTVKTSGGKDRASASGLIKTKPGAWAPPAAAHKHSYDDVGTCTAPVVFRNSLGVMLRTEPCPAKRQRAARKAKQTTIPGVDGAKASSSEASS
jgi:hypothetical protein